MALGGDILIKLGADVAELRAGFQQAGQDIKTFQDQITNLAAKAVAAGAGIFAALKVGEQISRIREYGAELQKNAAELATQAESLGLTTDQFQAYRAAALDSGQKVDVITTSITKFNTAIGQAAQGSKLQIDTLNDLKVKILDANGALRPQGDILQEVATKLLALPPGAKRAADETVLFGKAGQQLNPVLGALSQSTDSLVEKYTKLGLIIDQETITALDEMQRSADIAQQKIDVLLSKLFADVKGSVLAVVAKELEDITERLRAAAAYEGFLDKIIAFLQVGQKTTSAKGFITDDLDSVNKSIGEIQGKVVEIQGVIDKGGLGADAAADAQKQMAGLNDQLAKAYINKTKLETAVANITLPVITTTADRPAPGASNPAVRSSGAQPRDRVDEALAKLRLTQVAEEKALAALQAAAVETPLRDIERTVELQRKIDETIAAVASKQKGGATPDLIAKVTAQVTATETARSKVVEYEKAMQLADDTEKKFGDGHIEAATQLSKLHDAFDTGRVTTDAYNAAMKDLTLTQELQALASRGQVEGVDAIAAGFESAALRFAKANNSFALGGQIFDGTMSIMSQGLDQFVTTGTIQFDKLLASFASMLAQMAIKAAASSIFNSAFGAGGNGTGFLGSLGGLLGSGGGSGVGSGFTFAEGGRPPVGRASLVGEKGPELFVPDTAGRIITAGDTAEALQGMGGSQTVHQNLNFSLGVVPTVRAEMQKLLPQIAEAGAARAQTLRQRGGKYKSSFTR